MEERLLNPKDIPASLWDASLEALILPAPLASAYAAVIDRYGLRQLAESPRDRDNPPLGGHSQEHTDKHLAGAFDGSVARAQLALLDPKNHLPKASDTYLTSIAGNRVALTDAPCGAGAAALSFLTNVAELRASNVLPRQPLDVFLIGAELSDPARKYALELLAEVRPSLEQQAIFVEFEFISWDVTNALSNTDLIRKMTLVAAAHPNRLLVVANFNGFLERDGNRAHAQPQLTELFRHASGPQSLAVWIEPKMNRALDAGGSLPWLRRMFNTLWRFFAKERTPAGSPISTSEAQFVLPLQPAIQAHVGLAVIPIELSRTE